MVANARNLSNQDANALALSTARILSGDRTVNGQKHSRSLRKEFGRSVKSVTKKMFGGINAWAVHAGTLGTTLPLAVAAAPVVIATRSLQRKSKDVKDVSKALKMLAELIDRTTSVDPVMRQQVVAALKHPCTQGNEHCKDVFVALLLAVGPGGKQALKAEFKDYSFAMLETRRDQYSLEVAYRDYGMW
jgi:hypothetical protein